MTRAPDNPEERLLFDLVGRYSPSHEERPATEFLLETFRGWGWDARIDEVGNIVGELGHGPPTVCFLGHIDTVRGEIPVRVEGRTLYGRGAVDAKGPLAAAACAAARLPRDLGKKIVIVGAVEEETRTSRGARHIGTQLKPDFTIIGEPSDWDRITIGYKGILHYGFTVKAPRTHGASEKSSVATRAVSSFIAIRSAYESPDDVKSIFRSLTANIHSFNTQVDEFDETATMDVDLRLPPSVDPDEIEQRVRAESGDAVIEIHEKLPAVRCDKNSPLVRAMLRSIRAAGGTPRFAVKTGTSDMNVVAPLWRCPTVAYGPGDSSLDHTPNEHIDLDEYRRAIDVLEAVFQSL